MKIICRYSGVEFEIFTELEHFDTKKRVRHPNFHGWNVEGVHPIFALPTSKLLEKAEDWAARKLQPTEARLLFLALLNSTNLVDFQSTAMPLQATLENNMELLFQTVLWQSDVATPFLCHCNKWGCNSLHLPKFVISAAGKTHRLDNVKVWLHAWEKCRTDWYQRFQSRGVQERLTHKEELLYRLIHSAQRTTSSYASKLAEWAFDASGLQNETPGQQEVRNYWLKLFQLKGYDLYAASATDLDEMLDWFQTNLREHAGTVYAKKVLEHVRMLVEKNRKGILGSLMDLGDGPGNGVQIIHDSIEDHNMKLIAQKAPLLRPTEQDIGTGKLYETKIAYYNALSAWKMKQSLDEKNETMRKEYAEKQQENLLLLTSEEEVAAETVEDDLDTIRAEFGSALAKPLSEEDSRVVYNPPATQKKEHNI